MGWLLIKKVHEDEYYVIYSYSHDSDILDGVIKIAKKSCDLNDIDEWHKDCVELTLSKTDRGNHFAMKAIIFLAKICSSNVWEFPDKHIFAYG